MNITSICEVKANPNIPVLAPGDTVRVRQKVVEGEKTRIQVFQGVIIRIHHAGAGTNFTVRRVSYGVGVERTFPIYSPMIDGVEVVRHGKVRRAKLYYLRGLSARASRIKEKRIDKIGTEDVRLVEQEPEASEIAEVNQSQVGDQTQVSGSGQEPEASEVAEADQSQVGDKPQASSSEQVQAEMPSVEDVPMSESPKDELTKAEEQPK